MATLAELIANPAADTRPVAYFQPYDPVQKATVRTLYGTHALLDGLIPNVYIDGRLLGCGYRTSLFGAGRLSGRTSPNEGTVTLSNPDGQLDVLTGYGWAGRTATLILGFVTGSTVAYYNVIIALVQSIGFEQDSVVVSFRDAGLSFDREFQSLIYTGAGNGLPGGVNEGTADLAGRRKPDVYGICNNVEPVYLGLGAGKHRFAVSAAPIVDVAAVYDRGVPLTYNPAISTPVGPGEWTADLNRGIIILGGSFNGPVTCDVIGRRYKSQNSATSATIGAPQTVTFTFSAGTTFAVGETVRALASSDPHSTWMQGQVTASTTTALTLAVTASLGSGTWSSWTLTALGTPAGILSDIAYRMGVLYSLSARAALDALQPNTIGYYIPEGGNGAEILDAIADGSGCYWSINTAGNFRVGRINPPAGVPVSSLGPNEILDLERLPIDDPSSSIRLRRQKNWRVFATDQVAGAADSRKTFLTSEWRWKDYTDLDVAAAYPLGKALTVDSLYADDAATEAEGLRLKAIYGVRRDYFRVRVKLVGALLDLGATVRISHPRYGLASGRALVVVDSEADLVAGEFTLGLWG